MTVKLRVTEELRTLVFDNGDSPMIDLEPNVALHELKRVDDPSRTHPQVVPNRSRRIYVATLWHYSFVDEAGNEVEAPEGGGIVGV